MTNALLLSELTRDFVGNRSSHPKVIVPKFLVKSPEILIKSVCNIPRSLSLDETKSAH